jgi:hypothetical protein
MLDLPHLIFLIVLTPFQDCKPEKAFAHPVMSVLRDAHQRHYLPL